ncbi:MAG: cell division protein ZapA [Bacteroidota bacterium]
MPEIAKTITVVIAARPYPIRVKESEEPGLRKLVAEINAKFNEFQVKYHDRDKQDCLVMTLLTYASELRAARQAAEAELGGELTKRIADLEHLVDNML